VWHDRLRGDADDGWQPSLVAVRAASCGTYGVHSKFVKMNAKHLLNKFDDESLDAFEPRVGAASASGHLQKRTRT